VTTGEELFWQLAEPMLADPAVQRSTMMGLPCVRVDGRFFASLDRRTGALLVKLSAERVQRLIRDGVGTAVAPAGRTFREWVAVPDADRHRWRILLSEARLHASAAFLGFGPAGLALLATLERHNTKATFDAHRDTYERDLLAPARALVTELGEFLRDRVCADLRAEPRVGGSLFRVANDRRFDQTKPPYKSTVDIAFWQGPAGPRTDPALLLRISADEVHLGCGVFGLRGPALKRYRDALRDSGALTELDRFVDAALTHGAELSAPTRTRPPAGFDRDGSAARFAARDGFQVVRRYPRPGAVTKPAFVGWCADRLIPFGPIHQWLVRYVG
jgi:uncharacterized protein (TIGR02453 family)